jgi:hypothetical protein
MVLSGTCVSPLFHVAPLLVDICHVDVTGRVKV